MKKQKSLNEKDSILFIDSANIKISPDTNKNNYQKKSTGHSKEN